MRAINQASIPKETLYKFLSGFRAKQQARVIKGIYENQGMLTHKVCGEFAVNNLPDLALKSRDKLLKLGLELVCKQQHCEKAYNKSHEWYLCEVPQ